MSLYVPQVIHVVIIDVYWNRRFLYVCNAGTDTLFANKLGLEKKNENMFSQIVLRMRRMSPVFSPGWSIQRHIITWISERLEKPRVKSEEHSFVCIL